MGLIGGMCSGPINFLFPICLYLIVVGQSVSDKKAQFCTSIIGNAEIGALCEDTSSDISPSGETSTTRSGSRSARAMTPGQDVDFTILASMRVALSKLVQWMQKKELITTDAECAFPHRMGCISIGVLPIGCVSFSF